MPIGDTLGVVSGITLGSYPALQTGGGSAAVTIANFLVVGVTTVAGHFIGRAGDRKVTTIHITPVGLLFAIHKPVATTTVIPAFRARSTVLTKRLGL